MHSVFLEGAKLDCFESESEREGKKMFLEVFSTRWVPPLAIYIQLARKCDVSLRLAPTACHRALCGF